MSSEGTWGNQRHKSHRRNNGQYVTAEKRSELFTAIGNLPITEYAGTPPVNLNSVPPIMKGKSMAKYDPEHELKFSELPPHGKRNWLTKVASNLKQSTPIRGYGSLALLPIERVVNGKTRRWAEVEYFIEECGSELRITIEETIVAAEGEQPFQGELQYSLRIFQWGTQWKVNTNGRKMWIVDKFVGLGKLEFNTPHDAAKWLYRGLYKVNDVNVEHQTFPAYQAVR